MYATCFEKHDQKLYVVLAGGEILTLHFGKQTELSFIKNMIFEKIYCPTGIFDLYPIEELIIKSKSQILNENGVFNGSTQYLILKRTNLLINIRKNVFWMQKLTDFQSGNNIQKVLRLPSPFFVRSEYGCFFSKRFILILDQGFCKVYMFDILDPESFHYKTFTLRMDYKFMSVWQRNSKEVELYCADYVSEMYCQLNIFTGTPLYKKIRY